MEFWHSMSSLARVMNWCLGGAAVFGLFAGTLSVAAFITQIRRDALGQDRHLSDAARSVIVRELQGALRNKDKRTISVFMGIGEPSRDHDAREFLGELQGAVGESGLGSGGGGLPNIPVVGLGVAVDRSQLPDLDLVGIFRRAGLRARELPHQPFKRMGYTEAFFVFVTDKP